MNALTLGLLACLAASQAIYGQPNPLSANLATPWSFEGIIPATCPPNAACATIVGPPTYSLAVPDNARSLLISWTKALPQNATLLVRFGAPVGIVSTTKVLYDVAVPLDSTATLVRGSQFENGALQTGTYYFAFSVETTGFPPGTALLNNGTITARFDAEALDVQPASLRFSAARGGQNPPSQNLSMANAGNGPLRWSAAAVSNPSGWLRVTPSEGNTPGTAAVSVDIQGLPVGTYSGSVVVRSSNSIGSRTVPVVLVITDASIRPIINGGGVVSAGDFQPRLSRGSLAAIFGTSLASTSATASGTPWPRTLGGVRVTVDGVDAPLWFVSETQINLQIPFEASAQGNATVVVYRDGIASSPANVTLVPNAPSVFLQTGAPGSSGPMITGADGRLVTATNPAVPGDWVTVWGTGFSDLTVTPATGAAATGEPLSVATKFPTVTVGGVAARVAWAGLMPGAVGLAQVNIQVPSVPANSSLPLVITLDSVSSSPVSLSVR